MITPLNHERGEAAMPKKLDPDARPSEKLLKLFSTMLFSDRAFSLTELASILGCSKPTVLRLITNIDASQHAKIRKQKRGRESYYWLEHPDKRPKVTLDADGIDRLLLCRNFLLHLLPGAAKDMVDDAIERAAAYTSDDEKYQVYEGTGVPSTKGTVDYAPHQETLHTLIEAIRHKRVFRVSYTDMPREGAEFTSSRLQDTVRDSGGDGGAFWFAPKRLIYHRSIFATGWVVDGPFEPKKEFDTPTLLHVHRVKSIEMAKEKRSAAKLPEPTGIDAGYFGIAYVREFETAIRFGPSAADYISERTWSSDQKIAQDGDEPYRGRLVGARLRLLGRSHITRLAASRRRRKDKEDDGDL